MVHLEGQSSRHGRAKAPHEHAVYARCHAPRGISYNFLTNPRRGSAFADRFGIARATWLLLALEAALDARLRDNWRIRRNGRLTHAEATRLDGTLAERDGLSLLAGQRAFATIVHIASTTDQCATATARLRTRLPADARIAASANGERLVVRALARTGLALRRLIVPILSELSGAGTLPRLWHL